MAGEAELAGARCLADSEHRFLKEKHRELENHFANSPRWTTRAEKQAGLGFAARKESSPRRDPKRKKAAARARFGKLEAKRGSRGLIWELYRSRFASLARKSRDFGIEIRRGCAWLSFEQRKEMADTWAQGGSERGNREKREPDG